MMANLLLRALVLACAPAQPVFRQLGRLLLGIVTHKTDSVPTPPVIQASASIDEPDRFLDALGFPLPVVDHGLVTSML